MAAAAAAALTPRMERAYPARGGGDGRSSYEASPEESPAVRMSISALNAEREAAAATLAQLRSELASAVRAGGVVPLPWGAQRCRCAALRCGAGAAQVCCPALWHAGGTQGGRGAGACP
jgi:hypothetical protein